MKIHLWVSLARDFGSRRHRDTAGTRNGPSHEGENLGKDFEQDGLQTRHQRPGKEERSPSCSISRLPILCHFEGEEVFSFADSDILTLVCATRERALPAMALGRTAYKRNTSAEQASNHRTDHQSAWTLFNFLRKAFYWWKY
jgi:hypothetical protein